MPSDHHNHFKRLGGGYCATLTMLPLRFLLHAGNSVAMAAMETEQVFSNLVPMEFYLPKPFFLFSSLCLWVFCGYPVKSCLPWQCCSPEPLHSISLMIENHNAVTFMVTFLDITVSVITNGVTICLLRTHLWLLLLQLLLVVLSLILLLYNCLLACINCAVN